jgi:hypothetical protein
MINRKNSNIPNYLKKTVLPFFPSVKCRQINFWGSVFDSRKKGKNLNLEIQRSEEDTGVFIICGPFSAILIKYIQLRIDRFWNQSSNL